MVGAAFTETVANLVDEGFDFGLKDYPIFNEEYRAHLNKKIIEHYMFYEIGYETETLFRFALNRKMREIMPLYNQRYNSCFIAFDALSTQDSSENVTSSNRGTSRETSKDDETSKRTAQEHADDATQGATHETGDETGTRSTDGTTHGATSETTDSTGATNRDGESHETTSADSTGKEGTTSESDSTNTSRSAARNVASEFPQTMLSDNGDYATNAADAVNESHGTSNANASSTKNTTGHETGKRDGTTRDDETSTAHSTAKGTSDGTTHEASQDARSTTHDGTSDTTSTHDATSSETGTVGRAGARDLTTGDDGEMIRRLTGYSGVAASELVALYRATFLNVDMEIIEELGTLFMGLWNNGSDYERNGRYGVGTAYGFAYGFPRF